MEVGSDPWAALFSAWSVLSGFFRGALIEIGLDGVNWVSCESNEGVDGLDDASTIVGIDVVSEGLRDATLFVSENGPPCTPWFDMGNALACSTCTPVLA